MGTLLALALAAIIAKKLEDSTDYKTPKGKHKKRYM